MSLNFDSGRVRMARGRGVSETYNSSKQCVCERPHGSVLCNACGFMTTGRVRHSCPLHPQTVFLFDIVQCPQCKSYDFMMTEF